MFKHWRAVLGVAALIQPAWTFIKWALDWLGRLDLIASHLHDFGVQVVLDFIENPPPAALLPSMAIGLLLIWWDLKRKDAPELDFNQKLFGWVLHGMRGCLRWSVVYGVVRFPAGQGDITCADCAASTNRGT